MATTSWLKTQGDQVLLEVHVVPRASRSSIVGLHGERLKIQLDAPPVDGAANAALIAFVAKQLGLAKRNVTLLRGETSRQKTLALRGVGEEQVRALLSSHAR